MGNRRGRVARLIGALVCLVAVCAAAPGHAAEAQALLWRLERAGFAPGYLFGTVHLSEPDILDISPTVRAALLESDMLVGEGVPTVAFEAAMVADVARTRPAERAEAVLDPELLDALVLAARCYGIAEAEVRVLPLWPLVAIVVLLAPETVEEARQRRAEGVRILDEELAHIALTAGKFTLWIESPQQSIGFFKDLPQEDSIALLRQATADPTCRPDADLEPLVALYRAGDLDGLLALFEEHLAGAEDEALWRRLWHRLLAERNHGMVGRIESLARANRVFVAVGAAHLPGEQGVIALLRQRGWSVSPVE